jgi:tetratricopeptide (TPR) repeat protein
MNDLMAQDKALADFLIENVERGNEQADEGRHDEAIKTYLAAWQALPDPKASWDMLSDWIAGSLYTSYFQLEDYQSAKEWAKTAEASERSAISTSQLIDLGTACYELGEKEEAASWFGKAYELGEKRAFQSYDPKYLKFYLGTRK